MSDLMHCWHGAAIQCGGETYVSLRLVNAFGDFDAKNPHNRQGAPWFHMPTSKYKYQTGPDGEIPSAQDVVHSVMPIVQRDWPGMAQGKIVAAEQDATGKWGGINAADQIDAVTRIAIDLGRVADARALPKIILKPDEKLEWLRHPVVWVNSKDILKLPEGAYAQVGDRQSPYVVSECFLAIETADGIRQARAAGLLLQQTVGEMFEKNLGVVFRPGFHADLPNPKLEIASS